MLAKNFQRLHCRKLVFQVGEVECGDDLFGRQIQQQFPKRHAVGLGPEVPTGIRHRGQRELHHPLVRTEPAELLLVSHCSLPGSEIGHDLLDRPAQEALRIKPRCFADKLIAFAQREGQSDSHPAAVVPQFRDGI